MCGVNYPRTSFGDSTESCAQRLVVSPSGGTVRVQPGPRVRPGHSGYPTRMTTHDDEYGMPQSPAGSGSGSGFGATGGASATDASAMLGTSQSEQRSGGESDSGQQPTERWHRGLDLGLLVLRVVLGVTMFGHGMQKLFGLFGGPGLDGFADALGNNFGFTDHTTLLTWITALTESLGGLLLVVGLFSPLAAAGILGVAASAVYVKFSGGFFGPPAGFEYEFLLATCAFALLFTGPGRLAIDVHTPWRRKPVPFGLSGLVLAAAGCVVILILFR